MKITLSKPEKTILSAVKKYVEFIAPTYGPTGKKTLIIHNELNHEAVDDGKRSSNAFEIENEFENAVIQYIKETTQKGKDGTTTAGLIMGNIVIEALKDLNNELVTIDYHGLVSGLKKGLTEAVKKIKTGSTSIKTKEELYAIAYNSYNNEPIAKLIADTIFKIGKDGVLSIEDSRTTETTVEVVNGLEIPKGYYSPYLINQEDKVVLENPSILVVNKKIHLFSEVIPWFKSTIESGAKDIVIISEGFGDDVVNKSIAYKIMGTFRPLLVEVPSFGNKLETLQDIATVVGAQVIDDKVNKMSIVDMKVLGTCDIIKSTKEKTIILGGKGKTKEYIEILKSRIETTESLVEKDTLRQRIANLVGGVAVVKVGAYTENEQKGIKTKVENAVNSAQIAFRGGVVPGAGKALIGIKTSSELLNHALKAPRKQLEDNGRKYLDENTVDPTDVVITALESAVSIASGLLSIGGISVPKRKEEKDSNSVQF